MSTDGKGRLEAPYFVLSGAEAHARVIDPCALVSSTVLDRLGGAGFGPVRSTLALGTPARGCGVTRAEEHGFTPRIATLSLYVVAVAGMSQLEPGWLALYGFGLGVSHALFHPAYNALAVEFSDPPKAYSVTAYSQSDVEGSPHQSDQAALFAAGKMKRAAFTEAEIQEQLLETYRPGEE